jgi:chromosome partitioning protein
VPGKELYFSLTINLSGMPIISIAIQKGGSGKTTTAINLAAALKRQDKKVLLVDADPQANLSQSLGITEEPDKNLYTELQKVTAGKNSTLEKVIIKTNSGLPVVPASIELANAEMELVSVYGREKVFSWMLEPLIEEYDYIFIDCPPAIGMLTVNALVASRYVLLPLQAEFLPMKGLQSFMRSFERIKKQLNPDLNILGYLLTQYDTRKKMTGRVRDRLIEDFGNLVFETKIRTNIALAKAQEKGVDIFEYDKRCNGAKDYTALASEFLKRIDQ